MVAWEDARVCSVHLPHNVPGMAKRASIQVLPMSVLTSHVEASAAEQQNGRNRDLPAYQLWTYQLWRLDGDPKPTVGTRPGLISTSGLGGPCTRVGRPKAVSRWGLVAYCIDCCPLSDIPKPPHPFQALFPVLI